jgi:crotonobetainyl-CoA:carnitine CoA-transferase CaiB-like acyl-CoA transferase
MSRDRTGRGLAVETSMIESIVALLGDVFTYFLAHGDTVSDVERCAISQVFFAEGSDGRYVTVHCSTSEKFFRNLLSLLGRDELAEDPRFEAYLSRRQHYVELRSELEPLFTGRTAAEWATVLADADVPSSIVRSVGEVVDHPHVAAMGLFQDSGAVVPLMRAPWTFDGVRPAVVASVPRLGQHSRDVLGAVLPKREVDALVDAGVVGTAGESPPES